MVESDSQTTVILLNNKTHVNHPLFSIIQACKALIEDEWSCHILQTFRESNRVANCLACLGHSLKLGITVFEDPPPQISCVLDDDIKGISFARLIPSS
ncbi:hypothetical protein Ddye_018301 [Dipteronia dyeriana]|uniref:RNase H type-1 domain-containing protein n=1 Tax=Dipteronia dyeriana TaxID=168575 RepID=A0AAD9UAC8_9ROSI|nr:hypothetical protein Ddye_018301 [Dipteronia dyeriana]